MSLRNTEEIFGLVVYTGHQTKIQMNTSRATYKTSHIMRLTNRQIGIILLMQIVLASIGSALGSSWMFNNLDNVYLNFEDDKWNQNWFLLFIKTTGTWILIFTNFVPISLLVSLELVKFWQAAFMEMDLLMFDQNQENGEMKAQSSNINEELG